MAYDPKGLHNIIPGMSNTNDRLWMLNTTDAIATVNTSNYISDGKSRGMMQGDTVIVKVRASLPLGDVSAQYLAWVKDVGTGTDGLGVDITDGTVIDATDTD
ncbi:hypothetical protein [Neorhizobium sp. SOG26]|uniref:hypothetical protein n=1 Tax=Neorhizobium sp. SOG26 TaxID=2060726 RepID=UPI0018FFC39D|nr:hypothetical protein [Neorhizobium sp. SOG26]